MKPVPIGHTPSDYLTPNPLALEQLLQRLGQPPEPTQPAKRRPPGHIWLATEFHDAVAAHGKPHGVFDPDRQTPYRG